MSDQSTISLPHQAGIGDPLADTYASIGLIPNPDGSFTRKVDPFPILPAHSDLSNTSQHIFTKDIIINEANKTWARIFLPRKAIDDFSHAPKLPLIVDFHGGGFVLGSPKIAFFNDFYTNITVGIPAIIVSIDYRLAPEHRLPAAYDDCREALYHIKDTRDEWLIKYADFSSCFIMGSSDGGNIAYHVGLSASSNVADLEPLRIKGLVLHHPFFGGNNRTQSEIRLVNDKVIPPHKTDVIWELCLPIGVDRDHEYCNPMVGIKDHLLDQIRRLGWKILVTGYEGDPSIDRQVEFFKMLEEKGLNVVSKFGEGGCHGWEIMVSEKAKEFALIVKDVLIFSGNT